MTEAAVLRISPELVLPVEAVTETIAILAKRGAGKSYTASVFVEEMLSARLQVVVVDPMGHWWGLRSSADGKGVGYAIAVLGGDHADIPLESTAGVAVAELVVEERLSMVLDLSLFNKSERRRFVADFVERLYALNRHAMHVVLEEADLFAPEGSLRDDGDKRMLGAVYDLVRRGRGRGIGTTLITQRSASISKEVLDQTEILVALRTTGPRDRKAIEGWINTHGEDEKRHEVMGSLPSLPTGTAWVWWPVEGILRQIKVRTRRTFDSSATPRPGEIWLAPKTLADIDLEALQVRMAETIERAKADDPKELRRRIRELEETVETMRAANRKWEGIASRAKAETVIERVEVPVLNGQVEDLRALVDQLADVGSKLVHVGAGITSAIERVSAPTIDPMKGRVAAIAVREQLGRSVRGPSRAETKVRALPPAPHPISTDARETPLGKPERVFLATLARHPEGLSKLQIAVLSGYSVKSSSTSNALGRLRSLGLVERGDPIVATAEGLAAAGDIEPSPPPGPDLVAYWMAQLGKAERAFLTAFVAAWPADIEREQLADATGYSATSSSTSNALGRLRSLGLVDGLRASDALLGRA